MNTEEVTNLRKLILAKQYLIEARMQLESGKIIKGWEALIQGTNFLDNVLGHMEEDKK